MQENLFYGFRASIVIPNQKTIFNLNMENNSHTKNSIFREFFEDIKTKQKYESKYQNRVYYLIYKAEYGDIRHCLLARKTKFRKRNLEGNDIVEFDIDDYPYVNIFVDLKSQKFLIESNTQVFENYNTCGKVIMNIFNNNLALDDLKMEMNQISEENDFWNIFETDENKIYNIELKFVAPNIFGGNTTAEALLKETEEETGSKQLTISLFNSDGELRPNRNTFGSFVKYISEGGGRWSIKRKKGKSRMQTISSEQKATKVSIPISSEELKHELTMLQLNIIMDAFNSIEDIEKLKGEI